MKLPKEFINGFIIFVGIAIYFLLMEFFGLSDLFYLRLANLFFVFYGANRTIKMNIAEGNTLFVSNAVSTIITSIIGVFLCIIGLIIYSYMRGGDSYIPLLSKGFLFGGGSTVAEYAICLLFEGLASSVIVALLLILYWNNHLTND